MEYGLCGRISFDCVYGLMEAISSRAFQFLSKKLQECWSLILSRIPHHQSTIRAAAASSDTPTSASASALDLEVEEVVIELHDQEQNMDITQAAAGSNIALGSVNIPDPHVNNLINHSAEYWSAIIVGFCLTSAVEIALQSLQPQIKLPLLVHLLSLAIIFAFSFIFVSNFLSPNFPNVANALILMAKLSVFAAFFFAITVPFSLSLSLISWFIFGTCLLVIAYVACTSTGRVHA